MTFRLVMSWPVRFLVNSAKRELNVAVAKVRLGETDESHFVVLVTDNLPTAWVASP